MKQQRGNFIYNITLKIRILQIILQQYYFLLTYLKPEFGIKILYPYTLGVKYQQKRDTKNIYYPSGLMINNKHERQTITIIKEQCSVTPLAGN